MNYEYINKIIEDIYTEFGENYGNTLNKLLVKEQKENEILDKIKDEIDILNVVDCNITNYMICITKINEMLGEINE